MADNQVTDLRPEIVQALAACKDGDFLVASRELLGTLGYRSERTLVDQMGTVDGFLQAFPLDSPVTQSEDEFRAEAASAHLVFQVTNEEIAAELQQSLFSDGGFNADDERSFLFVAVELSGEEYSRASTLSSPARSTSVSARQLWFSSATPPDWSVWHSSIADPIDAMPIAMFLATFP